MPLHFSANTNNRASGLLFSTNRASLLSVVVGPQGEQGDSQDLFVSTIIDLRALPVPADGFTAILTGYLAAGDGGGGVFIYNSSSSATDDGGTIIAPDSGGGRWLRQTATDAVQTSWFGDVDGQTNDDITLAIQSAITNFNHVILRQGHSYTLTRQNVQVDASSSALTRRTGGLTLDLNGSTINRPAASYVAGEAFAMIDVRGASDAAHIDGFTLRNGTIDGKNTTQGNVDVDADFPQNLVQIVFVNNVVVDNVIVQNSPHNGLACGGCLKATIVNSKGFNNGKNNLYLSDLGSGVTVDNFVGDNSNFDFGQTGGAYFSGTSYAAISVASDYVNISNVRGNANGNGIAITFTGSVADDAVVSTINNVTMKASNADNFLVLQSASTPASNKNAVFNNLISESAGGNGFSIAGSKNITLSNSLFLNSTVSGILINETTEKIAVDNVIVDTAGQNAITITGATGVVISNSILRNATHYGVRFLDTGAGAASNNDVQLSNISYSGNVDGQIGDTGFVTALGYFTKDDGILTAGDVTIGASKFTIDSATGDTVTQGTLGVNGLSTLAQTIINATSFTINSGLPFQLNNTLNNSAAVIKNVGATGASILVTESITTASPGWYAQLTGDTVPRVRVGLNATDVASIAFGSGSATRDTFIERAAAANIRFGAPDAAAPVTQTLSVQNVVAGTANTAGADIIHKGSQGTGTGIGGWHYFQVSPAGGAGSSQNALVTALTIHSTGANGGVTVAGTLGVNGVTTTAALSASGATLRTGGIFQFNNAADNGAITFSFGTSTALTGTWSARDQSVIGTAARTFFMERHSTADTAGNNWTFRAGGATSGATDKNGGDYIAAGGIATGNGGSNVIFQATAPNVGAGTTDRNPVEVLRVQGLGWLKFATSNFQANGSGTVTISNLAPAGVATATITKWLRFDDGSGVDSYIPVWQ